MKGKERILMTECPEMLNFVFEKSELYVFCTPDNSSGKIDNTPFGKSSDLCIS